jgi:integrase/recombinase XerD
MPRDFQQFVKERKYLTNVSENTIRWYGSAWKAWEKYQPDFVLNARQDGVGAARLNCYLRALNAYFRWAGLPVIPKLKQTEKVIATYSEADVRKIIQARSKGRVQVLTLLLVDVGLRIDEALSIRVRDVDFDNLLIKVRGKGDKERIVPFSFDLRKHLFRFANELHADSLVFAAKNGRKLNYRNVVRDVQNFLTAIKVFRPPRMLHAFRHTFAVNYLRAGGSVFHLQKVLGHATLDMTRRYANLVTEDLQEMQQKVSLLHRLGR